MGKITKKSVNKVMELYSQNTSKNVICNFTDKSGEIVMEVHIKNSLTIPEKGMFVDRVVTSCFDADGVFMPQYLDPIFMITLLQMTTDIPPFVDAIPVIDENGNDTGEKTAIIDIEKTYELCRAVNLCKSVEDVAYQSLVSELSKMVEDKLDYMKQINIRRVTGVAEMINSMIPQIKELQNIGAQTTDELHNVLQNISSETSVPDLKVIN